MAFLIGVKRNNHFYIAVDGLKEESELCKLPVHLQQSYRIQKINDVTIAYQGKEGDFYHCVQTLDLYHLPQPLTKEYLITILYPKFLKFLVDYQLASVVNGMIQNSNFELMIMGKQFLYNLCSSYIYKVNDICGAGNWSLVSMMMQYEVEKEDDLLFFKKAFQLTDSLYKSCSYPFILCKDGKDTAMIFEKDGTIHHETLKENWRQKECQNI